MGELTTPLCKALGIEHPVFSVGFGSAAGPELAAAVSNAGGFGVLGASGYKPEHVRRAIADTRPLTDCPFGINFIIAIESEEDIPYLQQLIAVASAEHVAAVVLFWGDPHPYVPIAHEHGARVFIQVGSVAEAEAAVEAGVDVVIAQGVEAGGHVRGTESIWSLLPAVVNGVDPVPVLASGGIGDGAGLARALRLGAQGVSLGTRFVASEEAFVHPEYKRRVVQARAADAVYSSLFDVGWPDAPHRARHNRALAEWEAAGRPPSGSRPGEGTSIGHLRRLYGQFYEWRRYATGMATPDFDGDVEYAPMWAGESVEVVNDIKPAGQIVRDLVREAEQALREPSGSAARA